MKTNMAMFLGTYLLNSIDIDEWPFTRGETLFYKFHRPLDARGCYKNQYLYGIGAHVMTTCENARIQGETYALVLVKA